MPLLGDGPDLEKLVRRCRTRDADSWRTLVGHFQRLVYSIPKRQGLSDEDAADVFQATFTALFRSIDRLEAPETLPRWLAVTASRETSRCLRIRRASMDAEVDLDTIVAEEEKTSEETAVLALHAELIRAEVGAMDARCRDLLSLLYFEEDLSYAEIGSRVGMSVGAIGPTRARCLEKLRKRLHQKGVFE